MGKREVKPEIVRKLSKEFKHFSDVLQDGTEKYALFRGKIELLEDEVACISLLATDVRGNYKLVKIYADFGRGIVYYDNGVIPFSNEKEIFSEAKRIIYGVFDKISIDFDYVYFDLNHLSDFVKGYLDSPVMSGEVKKVLLLDNFQGYENNYCFGEASTIYGIDTLLIEGWRPKVSVDMRNEARGGFEGAKNNIPLPSIDFEGLTKDLFGGN